MTVHFCSTEAKQSTAAIHGSAKVNLSNLFWDLAPRGGERRGSRLYKTRCVPSPRDETQHTPLCRDQTQHAPRSRDQTQRISSIREQTQLGSPRDITPGLQYSGSESGRNLANMETARESESPQSDMVPSSPSTFRVLIDSLIPAADAIIDQKAQVKRSRDDEDADTTPRAPGGGCCIDCY